MIRAAIIGATGFTGAVLTDLLAGHPDVDPILLTSTSYADERVADIFPELRAEGQYVQYQVEDASEADVAFVCYPHAKAHPVVSELADAGVRVVDLSADFRLEGESYPEWYGFEHPRPDLLHEAVYGLPERYRDALTEAGIVANPGCFPTGTLLGLLPLAGWADLDGVIVDAKSGVSGAGRSPSEKTHFSAVHDNFRSYTEVGHRHTAEMAAELGSAHGSPVVVSFTPHLLPVDRGILSTIYVRLGGALPGEAELTERYRDVYANEPFVEVVERPPSLKEVQYTNACRMAVRVDETAGLVKIVSVIDNLVKGASGQAVQNMNLMFGFPEDAGLRRRV